MRCKCRIRAAIRAGGTVIGRVSGSQGIGASVMAAIASPYHGAYTITPSEQAQTIPTAGANLAQDIIIEPIPSNYGRIGYDGSGISGY